MLSKRELTELKALAFAHDTDPSLKLELVARIMTSKVSDPEICADITEFVRDILDRVTKKHSQAEDTAARQVCWGIMVALSAIAQRVVDELSEDQRDE